MNSIIFNDESYAHFRGNLMPQTNQSLGADLFAREDYVIPPGGFVLIKTGITIEKAKGVYIEIRGRSSMFGHRIITNSSPIDLDYKNEIMVGLINLDRMQFIIRFQQRVAQLIVLPMPGSWTNFRQQERVGGFGSTGEV